MAERPGTNAPVRGLTRREVERAVRRAERRLAELCAPSDGETARALDLVCGLLYRTTDRLDEAQRLAALGSWELDLVHDRLWWSDQTFSIFGIDPERFEASYDAFLGVVHPADRAAVDAAYATSLETRTPYAIDHRIVLADGETKWVHERGETRYDTNGKPVRTFGTVQDITERKEHEERRRLKRVMIECCAEGMFVTDAAGRVLEINPAFTRILGYAPDEVLGKTPRTWKSHLHDVAFYDAFWRRLTRDGTWSGEIWNRRRDGSVVATWLSVAAVRDADGEITHYAAALSDLSRVKYFEAEAERLAHFDPLTKLPNRVLANARISRALARARRHGTRVGLLIVDVDGFKHINESAGHPVGDALLIEVASRLGACIREEDTLARLGNDELIAVVEHLDDESAATGLAERFQQAVRPAIALGEREIFVTVCVGVALFPRDGGDAETLLSRAGSALSRAKRDGRDRFSFYTRALTARATERLALEAGLRRAIERDELELHYQPQLDLADGQVVGVEALVRWRHPEQGLVPPCRFIPIAEESGLIVPLGGWVLREACRQMRAWLDDGLVLGHVAVNLSARQIRQVGFVCGVREALEVSRLDAERLVLEVTEHAIVDDAERGTSLDELREMGVHLSIDDFGTGYSSLAYLKRLPVEELKIDRAFVAGLPDDANDVAIVKAVIALAGALGLHVVAEGVETDAQERALIQLGCRRMQGYRYSRPVPADEVPSKVASLAPWCGLDKC